MAADVNGAQTLTGFDSGDTLALSAALSAGVTPTVNSSASGSADVLNISLTEGADADYNALTIANVETINIDVTEDTAGGNAASRTATVGLSITQTTVAGGGSGAAQSVVITGTEDITIDTAVAVATIDASECRSYSHYSIGYEQPIHRDDCYPVSDNYWLKWC